MAYINDHLDPECGWYDLINDSIQAGINDYVEEIPTGNGQLWRD